MEVPEAPVAPMPEAEAEAEVAPLSYTTPQLQLLEPLQPMVEQQVREQRQATRERMELLLKPKFKKTKTKKTIL
jgi:hypothetical protein